MKASCYIISTFVVGSFFGCNMNDSGKTQIEKAQMNLQAAREESAQKILDAEKHLAATIMKTEKQIEKIRVDQKNHTASEEDVATRSGMTTSAMRGPSAEYCRGIAEGGVSPEEQAVYETCNALR